jgi:hypothetical protein
MAKLKRNRRFATMNPQNANLNPAQQLDSIASLIREYLVCDEHQLTTLTLWVAYTCVPASFAPPLTSMSAPRSLNPVSPLALPCWLRFAANPP